MKSKFLLSLPLVGCLAFVSCYPIPDKPGDPNPPKKDETVTSTEQQKIQAQRERMKEKEKKENEVTTTDAPKEKPENTTTSPDKPVEKRGDYAFANPVPGKDGFVFSPYNQKLVDVRDIPSGTLVQDPTYPASEKKYFRVP